MTDQRHKYLRVIFFLLIFGILFFYASKILVVRWPVREAENEYFFAEPQNSIDVLFIGSSSIYKGISPLAIWNAYGITSYVRSTSAQSPVGLYYSLVEALDNQEPDLVVLDGIILFRDYDYLEYEPYIQKHIQPKPISLRKLQLISEIWLNDYNFPVSDFLFPIFRYHTRWNQLDFINLNNSPRSNRVDTKGQAVVIKARPQSLPDDYMIYSEEKFPIQENSKYYYDRIINLCKNNSIDIVLVSLPKITWSIEKHNALQAYASVNNIQYLDFSLPDEIKKANLDLKNDFFDPSHLNIKGSQKFSKFLGQKLLEIYSLEDHRTDPRYKLWDKAYFDYKDAYLTGKNIPLNSEEE